MNQKLKNLILELKKINFIKIENRNDTIEVFLESKKNGYKVYNSENFLIDLEILYWTYQVEKYLLKKELESLHDSIIVGIYSKNKDLGFYYCCWLKINGFCEEILFENNNPQTKENLILDFKDRLKQMLFEIDKLSNNPDDYFLCSCCKNLSYYQKQITIENLIGDDTDRTFKFQCFSGKYCNHCFKTNREVSKLFERQKDPRFYD